MNTVMLIVFAVSALSLPVLWWVYKLLQVRRYIARTDKLLKKERELSAIDADRDFRVKAYEMRIWALTSVKASIEKVLKARNRTMLTQALRAYEEAMENIRSVLTRTSYL